MRLIKPIILTLILLFSSCYTIRIEPDQICAGDSAIVEWQIDNSKPFSFEVFPESQANQTLAIALTNNVLTNRTGSLSIAPMETVDIILNYDGDIFSNKVIVSNQGMQELSFQFICPSVQLNELPLVTKQYLKGISNIRHIKGFRNKTDRDWIVKIDGVPSTIKRFNSNTGDDYSGVAPCRYTTDAEITVQPFLNYCEGCFQCQDRNDPSILLDRTPVPELTLIVVYECNSDSCNN